MKARADPDSTTAAIGRSKTGMFGTKRRAEIRDDSRSGPHIAWNCQINTTHATPVYRTDADCALLSCDKNPPPPEPSQGNMGQVVTDKKDLVWKSTGKMCRDGDTIEWRIHENTNLAHTEIPF